MNSSPKKTADTNGRPAKAPVAVDLRMARQMLPLIRSIVSEIVGTKRHLGLLSQEQERLDKQRRQLEWKDRNRRYSIGDEVVQVEQDYSSAIKELESLGLKLVDPDLGEVEIPTRINGRQAAFSWKLGEDAVAFWHYDEEDARRPIPSDWHSGSPLRLRANP
jgi:hypothetical protein